MNAATELAEFSELIDLIYQGATDFGAWQRTAEAISKWIGSTTAAILTPTHTPEMGGFIVSHGHTPRTNELWATRYQAHDIWTRRALERDLVVTGTVLRDQQLVSDEEFLLSEFSRELLAPVGLGRLLSGIVFSGLEQQIPVVVTCLRPFQQPYTEQDAEKLATLVPHISRAVGVMLRLRDTEFRVAANLLALDRLAGGVLLFQGDGGVVFANSAARRILDRRDGLSLRGRPDGEPAMDLLVHGLRQQEALDEAIRESVARQLLSTRHFAKAITISRPSRRTPFTLNFSHLPASNEFGRAHDTPRAIAFLNDSTRSIRINAALLKLAYGLTAAEILVAELIANGHSTEEVALARCVSANTIKTQLRAIHGKTQTGNRATLIKLLLSLGEPA